MIKGIFTVDFCKEKMMCRKKLICLITFVLLFTFLGAFTASAPAFELTATPSFVEIPKEESGLTTISWPSPGVPGDVYLYLFIDGVDYGCMATQSGSCPWSAEANWIQRNHTYDFKLFTDESILLDTVRVEGVKLLRANARCSVPDGKSGNSVVSWGASGYSIIQIYVSTDGGNDGLWAQYDGYTARSETATWIQRGSTYDFTMYSGTSKTNLLDEVTVEGTMHMPLEDSEYLSLGADVQVTTETTLLSKDVYVEGNVHDVYFQSDGRFYPSSGNVGLCSIYITVNGERVSNKSEIDWSTSYSPVQHSFNAIGLVSLSTGTHTISLIAESANHEPFAVGAGANLCILIEPAPVVAETVLNSPYCNIQHTTLPYFDSIPSDTILSTNIVADDEDIVAMISGVSTKNGSPGDAMWGIYLDGLHRGCMYSSWTVNDIYSGAETLAPMYAHAFFPASMTSADSTVSFIGTEFPWKDAEDTVIYDIESTARLVVFSGGMSVAGNAHNVQSPCYSFYQWNYQIIGGNISGPPIGTDTVLASEVINVPSGHNGNVMFVAKYRAQADSSDPGGYALIWIEIDGLAVGSLGDQQLDSPYSVSQRTLCASYLATGSEALSEGNHTVEVYGRVEGDFRHLGAHRETLLVWFD